MGFFFYFIIILKIFIYLFLAVLGLRCCSGFSLVVERRLLSSCGEWASRCGGFSCGAQSPGHTGFSSGGSWD